MSRFKPILFPAGGARARFAAWVRGRLPALRAAPIPPCRHPDLTLLIYAFPADGDFTLFEHAIRQSWAVLGALPTVVVTHDAAIVPALPGVAIQVEPTLRPGDLGSMSRDCLTRLHTRFATRHVLIVQDDGFPLRDDLARFLRYDYVGAPNVRPGWRARVSDALGLTVLNGGFSLRSRRMCRWAARVWRVTRLWPRRGVPPEDRVYSPLRRLPFLRFPSAATAARFSQDTLDHCLLPWPGPAPMGLHRAQTFQSFALIGAPLTVVSVVRDHACHRRCLLGNPHLRGARFVTFDNTRENLPIPARYNAFIDAMPADTEWILFAHEDFQPLEDPRPLLRVRLPWFPYGLVGTRIVANAFILPFGQIWDSNRDGTARHDVRGFVRLGKWIGDMVDAFDCCGFFIHADLLRTFGLRFDPAFAWDLYAEDFCYQYALRTGHLARLLPLAAHHWSHGDSTCERFLGTLRRLNAKYHDAFFAGGTCTAYVGGHPPLRFRLWRRLVRRLRRHGLLPE